LSAKTSGPGQKAEVPTSQTTGRQFLLFVDPSDGVRPVDGHRETVRLATAGIREEGAQDFAREDIRLWQGTWPPCCDQDMTRPAPAPPLDFTDNGRCDRAAHRYGGEHHRLSLVDQLGARVERGLHDDDDLLQRDPAFIKRLLPALDLALAYFDPEVEGFERLPSHGPILIVGNHSGGIYMPDYWAFLRHWVRERGVDDPLYSLCFDLLFALPGINSMVRRLGTVPANRTNASRLLAGGHAVLVYPGGDEDDYRPWTERHRVDLHGRTGFVRLALRHQVPVVPLVAQGGHDTMIILARGDMLARRLGLDRLRINILPLVAGPPWGIATFPLPAKVTVRVCEPLDWSRHGTDAAFDPVIVRHCYEEVLGRMQANLDELVAALPHPVIARLLDPLRRSSARRGDRP
jgi:1-acyl-sn-glycerol-3-phosphate acyltransferase